MIDSLSIEKGTSSGQILSINLINFNHTINFDVIVGDKIS